MSQDREFKIVVWGATGVTGTFICEKMLKRVDGEEIPWAMAGRSEKKLEALRERLSKEIDAKAADIPILIGNSNDQESVNAICAKTEVVIACVGPFIKFGEPMVKACVENNTQYLDITGEPGFIKLLTEKYDAQAKENGTIVMPCSGIDSVPADIGVLFTQEEMEKVGEGAQLCDCEGYVELSNQVLSHGTYSTLLESFENYEKPKKKVKKDKPKADPRKLKSKGVHYEKDVESYTFPFPTSDPHIVRMVKQQRNTLPEHFNYVHYLKTSMVWAILMAIVMFIFSKLAKIPFFKNILKKYKAPGDGPKEDNVKNGKFVLTFIGRGYSNGDLAEKGGDYDIKVKTRYECGECYNETAVIAIECALGILALDEDTRPAGVMPPGTVLGTSLVEPLIAQGQKFQHISTTKI